MNKIISLGYIGVGGQKGFVYDRGDLPNTYGSNGDGWKFATICGGEKWRS